MNPAPSRLRSKVAKAAADAYAQQLVNGIISRVTEDTTIVHGVHDEIGGFEALEAKRGRSVERILPSTHRRSTNRGIAKQFRFHLPCSTTRFRPLRKDLPRFRRCGSRCKCYRRAKTGV